MIYINFNFDFLSLDNVYFENYFANKQLSFYKTFTTFVSVLYQIYKRSPSARACIYIYIYSTICRHAHVSAFHASSVQLWYMLERDDHRTYTHESALTRRMWYSTVTPTDPDMRRVSWGQSALTTTREVSFALSLLDTHELRRVLNNTEVKERNIYIYIICSTICRHAHVSAFHASSVQLWYMLERDDHRIYIYRGGPEKSTAL